MVRPLHTAGPNLFLMDACDGQERRPIQGVDVYRATYLASVCQPHWTCVSQLDKRPAPAECLFIDNGLEGLGHGRGAERQVIQVLPVSSLAAASSWRPARLA